VNKIKKNDNVIVTTGKDKGKKGKILKIFFEEGKAIVEKVNIIKKHKKQSQKSKGGILEMPAPINISKLKLVCPESGKPTRVRIVEVNGEKKRKAVVSGAIID
jgi:large subunit ribosomal protein L24